MSKCLRKPANEAKSLVAKMTAHGKSRAETRGQLNQISSVGTTRTMISSLTQVARWLKEEKNEWKGLHKITLEEAREYLSERAEQVQQKTLDNDRIALSALLNESISRKDFHSTYEKGRELGEQSRGYSDKQIKAIANAQSKKNALATHIAVKAGLRAQELITLRQAVERPENNRNWNLDRFKGLEGVKYTVKGKGGLVREVIIPSDLAEKLEQTRLEKPVPVRDREINYQKFYDIGGGNSWSKSFSEASKRTLGWSQGGHGLRHSYVQNRMENLQSTGFLYADAKAIVSQEVGHFREDITEAYLR
jgi:integrase